jgi:polar amino acid transport system substrate-binding protein
MGIRSHLSKPVGLAAAGVALLVASACGGSSSTSSSSQTTSAAAAPSVAADSALAAKVPAAIKSDGTISVGTDASYAPSEFIAADGKTIEGFDVDLFNAVAQKLGLKTKYTSAPFAALIPSVLSGKYELSVSSFTINPEREKTVDMVSYYSAGTQWGTKKGNPSGVQPDNACGKPIAVQKGTVQVDDITARSKKCTDAGKPAIKIDQYQGQDTATASVVSGKDDAMLADSPVVAYAVKQTGGQLETLGPIYEAAPYGYVIKKGQGEYAQAVSGAVNALIKDGTYKKVLEKWGVQQGAITTSQVDPKP